MMFAFANPLLPGVDVPAMRPPDRDCAETDECWKSMPRFIGQIIVFLLLLWFIVKVWCR